MNTQPPGTHPSALIAFSLVDALMRRLVRQQTIVPEDAIGMIEGIVADLRASNRSVIGEVVHVLEKMLQEYRKQTR